MVQSIDIIARVEPKLHDSPRMPGSDQAREKKNNRNTREEWTWRIVVLWLGQIRIQA